jgi:hypothetical protein
MQCSDTGSMDAIHIPRETIELAQELQTVMDAIRTYGDGTGQISMQVQHGKIPFIDWTFRKIRNIRNKK